MLEQAQKKELEKFALKIRIGTLEALKARGFGHIGGSLSIADLLAVLYGGLMNVDPKNPNKPDRDKLICSKGHAGPAVYAALALRGFFPYEELKTLNQPGTNLPSHCDRQKTKGVDMTTGSLGQGTSLAAGMALGDMLRGRKNRVFLIVGDGEINEGQVWEAAMFTAAKKITNLIWLIDDNKKQLDGYTDDVLKNPAIEQKFQAFGFEAASINGHDLDALHGALAKKAADKPLAFVLNTVKGRGLAEVENTFGNHSMAVSSEVFDKWLGLLQAELAALN